MRQTDKNPAPKSRKKRKYSRRKLIRLLKVQAFMATEYRELLIKANKSIMELHTYYNERLE